MKIGMKLVLTATLLGGASGASADTEIASDGELTALKEVGAGHVLVVSRKSAQKSIETQPNVFQALAAAITQTAVRQATQPVRQRRVEGQVKDVVVRKHRMTMRYTRDLYDSRCYLAVGPVQKWLTINGYFHNRRVNARSLARALAVLRYNGMRVKAVTISTRTNREMELAKRLLHRLRLQTSAIVGCNPNAPNSATISFTNTTHH